MKDLHTLYNYRLVSFERAIIGKDGDAGNGVFKIFVKGKAFFAVASNGGGWEHFSVSRKNRCPTWDEMCAIKDMFFLPEEAVVQYHPRRSEYVNLHQYCLHLWRPIGKELLTPPREFV